MCQRFASLEQEMPRSQMEGHHSFVALSLSGTTIAIRHSLKWR
jgi:hypothetical protein